MTGLVKRARQRVSHLVGKWEAEAPARRFMGFCRGKWPPRRGDSVVLVGLFASYPSIFCYAYVTNHLAERHGSRIESYQFIGPVNPLLRKLYESFGARFALGLADAASHERQIEAQAEEIFSGLKTKWEVMQITVEGVLIGDQVYDSYLRFFNEPTVRLDDPRLRALLVQALQIFYATRDYLARTQVSAFITDDFSYINAGIVTRLMHRAGVPIYMVLFGEPFWLLQLDPGPSGMGHQYPPPVGYPYYAYRRLFAGLSAGEKDAATAEARTTLEERLSGKFCPLVRMPSTTYAASTERVLEPGPEPRILVMLHDFIDSPHGYRELLFPDFYEWITFLLERAEKTPFRWYVKPHPCMSNPARRAMNQANDRVLADLERRFPKATFLSGTASNQQIIADGVTAMFTVHGTCGHEYAYRGVPVVNCGDNPHIAYDFNIHARTLEQYEACIRDADRLQVRIDARDIEEFFHMHYFHLPRRLGSPVNPIDSGFFAEPDWTAQINEPAALDRFIDGVTPARERGVAEYFDRFFGQPDLLNPTKTL